MLRRCVPRLAAPLVSSTQGIGGGADAVLERDWHGDGEFFCRLCCEPLANPNEHIGKRDHICLELFFNVICETARSWPSPRGVYLGHDDTFSVDVPMRNIFRYFDTTQLERRNRIHALLRHLVERGVVYLGPQAWRDNQLNKLQMGQMGAVAMFLAPHPQIMHLFPKADAAQIASFSQACYNQYSLETVFDFLAFGELLDARDLQSEASERMQTSVEHVHYALKAIVVRNVLGQIRFAMSGGHKLNHPLSKKFEPHVDVLCEELATCLITEILYVRACEFASRADKVWRAYDCPTVAPPFVGTIRDIQKHGISPTFDTQKHLAARSSIFGAPRAQNGRASSSSSSSNANASFLRFPPGVKDHMPSSATENAIHMIHACYHSALEALLGRAQGDVSDRSGGEAFSEAERSLRAPIAEPAERVAGVLQAAKKHEEAVAREAERIRKRRTLRLLATDAAGVAGAAPTAAFATIDLVSAKAGRAPLSPAAKRLMMESIGLQAPAAAPVDASSATADSKPEGKASSAPPVENAA